MAFTHTDTEEGLWGQRLTQLPWLPLSLTHTCTVLTLLLADRLAEFVQTPLIHIKMTAVMLTYTLTTV